VLTNFASPHRNFYESVSHYACPVIRIRSRFGFAAMLPDTVTTF